jgi:type IV pilus assembly protein PilM
VAAKKEMVNAHAALVREAGLNPVVIDVDSFAIQNAVEAGGENTAGRVVGLINIGSDVTNINIIQNNIPYFTRDLSVGSNVFTQAVQRDFGVTFEEAENMLSGATEIEDADKFRQTIASAASDISMGIERSIAFLKTAGDAERIDHAVLSGGGACVPFLRDILSEKHGIDFTVNHAVAQISAAEGVFESAGDDVRKVGPLLTVALGLALRREAK